MRDRCGSGRLDDATRRRSRFGSSTEWVGKTITFDDGQFALEGEGNIRPADVMGYDRQGFLEWATGGLPPAST